MVTETRSVVFHVPADAERWTPTPAKVHALVERIVERFDPEQVIVFGSVARDEVRRDSDVDLLVVFDHVDDVAALVLEIRMALHGFLVAKDVCVASIDDVNREHGAGSFLRPALGEGVVAYSRPR